jgi:hypothetical protein
LKEENATDMIREIELWWKQPWTQKIPEIIDQVFRDRIKVVKIGEYTH